MEWWKLWIPFIGTIITLIVNIRVSKKQNEKNEEFQKTLAEQSNDLEKTLLDKKIAADLKAKSRIEWIQTVRHLVADLILHLSKLKKTSEKSKEEFREIIEQTINKIVLLELYIGPDSSREISEEEIDYHSDTVLYNKQTNENKNEVITDFLETIKVQLEDVQKNIEELEEYNSVEPLEVYITHKEVFNEEGFVGNAETLKNIFRIYFKIEWNRAKNGN